MIYTSLILWILISSILCFGRHLDVNRNRKIFIILSFIYMGVIMAFRSVEVGVDTKNYQTIFELMSDTRITDILSNFHTYSMEVGYALFMKICSIIYPNYYFFQVVFTIIFSILAAKFIYEETDNIFVGVIVFLGIGIYATTFNIARQMLATVLVANSWTLLKRERRITAILCVLIASTFHFTAFIFFAAFVVYFYKNNKYIIRALPIMVLIVALNFRKLFPIVTKYFSFYHNYYANEKVIQTAGHVWIIWTIVFVVALIIIYLAKKSNLEHSMVALFALIWVACNVIGLSFNYFERIGLYFIPFIPVLFSFSDEYLKNRTVQRIYISSMSLAFMAYFLISMNSTQYVYSTFLW